MAQPIKCKFCGKAEWNHRCEVLLGPREVARPEPAKVASAVPGVALGVDLAKGRPDQTGYALVHGNGRVEVLSEEEFIRAGNAARMRAYRERAKK